MPAAKEAFLAAARIAHGAGRKVALSLSDTFCVDRYRAEFKNLIISGTVDLVFCNEGELKSLYPTPRGHALPIPLAETVNGTRGPPPMPCIGVAPICQPHGLSLGQLGLTWVWRRRFRPMHRLAQ